MRWVNKTLGDLLIIKGGKRLPKGCEFITTPNNHLYIRARDIKDGKIDVQEPVYIDENTFEQISNYIVNQDDIVITIVGANIGDIGEITEEFDGCNLTENAVKLIPNNLDVLYPKFLKYSIYGDYQKNKFQQIASGSAQGKLGIYKIKTFEIDVPPLQTQKNIASILSGYDDLIENNLKRIKLLEETAQNIYKEWFVNFRFANYEDTEFDTESGLPVGWKKIQVRDYVKIISKGPSLNYDADGIKYPVLNQSCIRNGEIELDKILYANELNTNKEYCYLNINDILVNSMGQGTLGRVSKNVSITSKFIIHNCITFLRAKPELSQYQLFYFISDNQKYFESVSQGSTGQTTLKLSLIEELKINKPTNEIIRNFDLLIAPNWKQIGILKNQNLKLKEARDILLPRLMNRRIEV